MKRKVIQLAKNTLVISIPAKWARLHKVNKGEEVEIDEKENFLVISPESYKAEEKATITFKNKNQFLRRVIDTPYRMGYNEVRIEFDDQSLYYKIQSEVNNLMGFEIIKQGEGYCVAKNIAEGLESEFESSFNRLFLVTINFLEEISADFNDSKKLEIIKNTEDITNRLAHFCKRMLNLEKIPNSIRSRSTYRIVCLLEEIGDIGKKMCEYIIKNKIKIGKKNIDYLNKIINQIRLIYKLTNKFEHSLIPEYGNLEKSNEKLGLELIKNPNKENYITFQISSIVENIKHMSEEVFE